MCHFCWGRGHPYIDRLAVSRSRVPTEAVVEPTAFVASVKTAISDQLQNTEDNAVPSFLSQINSVYLCTRVIQSFGEKIVKIIFGTQRQRTVLRCMQGCARRQRCGSAAVTRQVVNEALRISDISVSKINLVSITVLCVIGFFKFLLYFQFSYHFYFSFSFYFRFRVQYVGLDTKSIALIL